MRINDLLVEKPPNLKICGTSRDLVIKCSWINVQFLSATKIFTELLNTKVNLSLEHCGVVFDGVYYTSYDVTQLSTTDFSIYATFSRREIA